MQEPFEYRGRWWLPEKPEHQVPGILAFSQEDVTLELLGRLPREERSNPESGEVTLSMSPESRDRILGFSTDGKSFTLEHCHARGMVLPIPGITTEVFYPSVILEGAHYASGQEVVFDEFAVRFSHLDAWAQTSGFSRTFVDGDTPGLDMAFRQPPSVEVKLPSAIVKVGFGWGQNHTLTEVTVTQRADFRLIFPEPTPFQAALNSRCSSVISSRLAWAAP